jgi:hypothetical protein
LYFGTTYAMIVIFGITLSRSATWRIVYLLAPPDILVSEVGILCKGKGRGGLESSPRRIAIIRKLLSIKTSTRRGKYHWWPVRPRGGLTVPVVITCILKCLFSFRE